MSAVMQELLSPAVLDQAVEQTFTLLIGCDSGPSPAEPAYAPDDLLIAVYCDENQQSAVVLRCSRLLGSIFAERMLEIPREEVQEDDLIDATGELVNVIAGTLRGLLPAIGAMSPPFLVPLGDLDHLPLSERHYQLDTLPFHISTAFNC